MGCSSAGEISDEGVSAGSVVVTAVRLDGSQFEVASARLADMDDSRAAGHRLAAQLKRPGLQAVMVFGQGVNINGSALLAGMNEVLPSSVPITGGLAGDDGAFQRTYTLLDDQVSSDGLVAVGFHGQGMRVAHGCFGGWEPFGVTRKITRAAGNVLYELDGEPALDLYKRYLGEYAKDLPASGLLYPFELLDSAVTAHARSALAGRVLLVEDNAVNRMVAVSMLQRLGVDSALAGNGREAIEAIARERFDLVLMDCQMPEMDGFAATRAIRAGESTHGGHVPIVALTANATVEDRARCIEAGMDDYLSKPFTMDQLAHALERWLTSTRSRAAHLA